MQSLDATRTELLDRRRRAVFVAEGRALLQDKRTALVREFRQHQAELLEGLEELRKLAVRHTCASRRRSCVGRSRSSLVPWSARPASAQSCGPRPWPASGSTFCATIRYAATPGLGCPFGDREPP